MKRSTRWLVIVMLMALAVLATSCQRATPAPSPTPLPPPPTAFPIPTRPAQTKGATPTPTPEIAQRTQDVATEETPIAPATATVTPETSSNIVGWAYVDVLRTSLFDEPGGNAITALKAGERLDILEASPDRAWLRVRYQKNENAEPVTGWVLTSRVRTFVDVSKIPAAGKDEVAAEAPTSAPLEPVGSAVVQAQKLNLRAEPGIDQPIIGKLSAGEQVTLLGRSDNGQWLKIQTEDGEIGWAASAWLKSNTSVKTLPVVGKATTGVPKPAPAPSGKIVFQDRPGGNIYIMNANGSDFRKLTTGLDPAFSPDGKQIAFARWESGKDTIRVINADGSGERVLIQTNKPRSPTWSPDGKEIVLERIIEDRTCRDTPLGCATDEQIRKEFNGNDCWTYPPPIGTYCIWDFPIINISIAGLEKYTASGQALKTLPAANPASAPRYHPSRPLVLHLTREGVNVAYADQNQPPKQLISGADIGAPIYSPDGRYIYISKKDGDSWNIWRYNADGSGPIALTHPPALRDHPVNSVAPAASPDGRFILFLSDRNGSWQMWIMNSDGSNQRLFMPRVLKDIEFQFDFGRARMIDWK